MITDPMDTILHNNVMKRNKVTTERANVLVQLKAHRVDNSMKNYRANCQYMYHGKHVRKAETCASAEADTAPYRLHRFP